MHKIQGWYSTDSENERVDTSPRAAAVPCGNSSCSHCGSSSRPRVKHQHPSTKSLGRLALGATNSGIIAIEATHYRSSYSASQGTVYDTVTQVRINRLGIGTQVFDLRSHRRRAFEPVHMYFVPRPQRFERFIRETDHQSHWELQGLRNSLRLLAATGSFARDYEEWELQVETLVQD